MEKLKETNRRYLRKVFTVKTVFYPVLYLVSLTGAGLFLESAFNRFVRIFGIKKSVRFFFKYRLYGKWFRNSFSVRTENSTGRIIFPMMAGVNSNFTLLNLLLAKYFRESDKLESVFYICDAAVGICTKDGMLKSRTSYPWFCHECWKGFDYIEKSSGIETVKMSEMKKDSSSFIDAELNKIDRLSDISQCYSYSLDNIPVGKFARKSTLRYFLTGSLEENDEVVSVYRSFIKAGAVYSFSFRNLLERYKDIKYGVMNNGSLLFEAIARHLLSEKGIPYITYETYIGNNSLVYKYNGAVMDFDWRDEYSKFRERFSVTEDIRGKVSEFFANFKKGVEMYAVLNREHSSSKLEGIGKYACLFTNLNFDTAVIDKNSAFSSMEDWIIKVIEYWKTAKPGIKLVIRIHPGELKLVTASKEFMGERIRNAAGSSDDIIVFDTWEKVNSYELIAGMEFGLIYSSTIGLEIAWEGKKCLSGGLPWFREKPFILFADTKEKYFSLLNSLIRGEDNFSPDTEELIRTVWYIFFVRLKRFSGLRLYTPREDPNTDHDDMGKIISENRHFFDEFRDELFGRN